VIKIKYQKYHKGDYLFGAIMSLVAGCIFLFFPIMAIFVEPAHFWGIIFLHICSMASLIVSLIFLLISRHNEREYKIIRTIRKLQGLDDLLDDRVYY
jgi:hypothetical protein